MPMSTFAKKRNWMVFMFRGMHSSLNTIYNSKLITYREKDIICDILQGLESLIEESKNSYRELKKAKYGK